MPHVIDHVVGRLHDDTIPLPTQASDLDTALVEPQRIFIVDLMA
jgi:hypothetical protein